MSRSQARDVATGDLFFTDVKSELHAAGLSPWTEIAVADGVYLSSDAQRTIVTMRLFSGAKKIWESR